MKEKRDAQQAYKSAMEKMKMPAQLDCDTQMMSSGTGRIKMKSRVLACTAAAAVLAVCVAVGAIVIHNKSSDDNIKTSTSSNYKLEDDQTIPSGEIKSVEQAIEEHQKCLLLENDEYIKLETNKDNITKQMAQSFTERTEKISERNEECLNYISKCSDDKTLFAHAIKYDNGCIDLSFHLDSESLGKFDELYEKGYGYYICKADTGEKLLRCITKYNDSPTGITVGTEGSQTAANLEKLTGKLSYMMIGSDELNEKETVLNEFEFFDKVFIGTDERAKLKQLAAKAMGTQEPDAKNYENSVNITADKVVCSQHGMYMRLTVTPANDTGKSLIGKYFETKDINNLDPVIFLSGGSFINTPEPDVNLGKPVTNAGWQAEPAEITAEKIIYDCYLPITRAVDVDFGLTVFAKVQDPTLTADEIAEGIGREIKLGSIKVKYEKPMKEREFVCGDKKILLSDLCVAFSKTQPDVTDISLNKSDGTVEKLTKDDFSRNSIMRSTANNDGDALYDEMHEEFMPSDDITDQVRACFITKQVDTSKVTSIIYAGDEYKLPQSEENTQTQSGEYKSVGEAEQALGEAYQKQLDILQKYKSEKSTLTAESVKQLCEESDACLDTIGRAGEWLSHQQLVSVLARRTTANELILYLWSSDDFRLVGGSTVKSDCDISADGQVIARGELLQPDPITPPDDAGYERYMVLTLDCKGSDLSSMNTNQQYSIAFFDNAGGVKNVNFGLASDTAEMPLTERLNLLNEMRMSVNYKAFNIRK